jgi:hypothetical protein
MVVGVSRWLQLYISMRDSITMEKQQTSNVEYFEGMNLCVCASVRVLFQFPTRVIILDLEFLHLCTAIHSHFRFYIKHRGGKNFSRVRFLTNFSAALHSRATMWKFTWRKTTRKKICFVWNVRVEGLENNFSKLRKACYSTLAQHFMI